MITTEEILTVARCFAGTELSQEEEAVLSTLCEGASALWTDRLRADLTPEDCRGTFITACAWTALGGMTGAMEQNRPAPLSFSAGDLSVHTGARDANACARSLRAQAQELMAPYTKDTGFAFLGVEG